MYTHAPGSGLVAVWGRLLQEKELSVHAHIIMHSGQYSIFLRLLYLDEKIIDKYINLKRKFWMINERT